MEYYRTTNKNKMTRVYVYVMQRSKNKNKIANKPRTTSNAL